MFKTFEEMHIAALKSGRRKTLVLAGGEKKELLQPIAKATQEGVIFPVFISESNRTSDFLEELNLKPSQCACVEAEDSSVAEAAVAYMMDYDCDILMKGTVATSDLIRSVLKHKRWWIKGSILSHISLLEVPYLGRMIGLSDTSINIAPSVETRALIIENSYDYLKKIGFETPKVALLSSVETVDSRQPDTVESCLLAQRFKEKGYLIEGPLSLDLALDPEAVKTKGFKGDVAGDADLLVVPEIVSGNLLGKSYNAIPDSKFAGIVLGAVKPIVLTSRASSLENKYYSILAAAMAAEE